MNSLDLIRMGLSNLFRRKTRTFLTVLGVIIGTASIVTMVSLGFGMKESLQTQLGGAGSLTVIQVDESYDYEEMRAVGGGISVSTSSSSSSRNKQKPILDDSAVMSFRNISNVIAVSPEMRTYLRLVSGKYVCDTSIIGLDPSVMADFSFQTASGRLLESGEEGILFGKESLYGFYDPKRYQYPSYDFSQDPLVDVLSDKISITFDWNYGNRPDPNNPNQTKAKLYRSKGVGVLDESNMEYSWSAYMDITVLKKLVKDNEKSQSSSGSNNRGSRENTDKYDTVKVKVDDMKNVTRVQEEIKAMGYQTFSLTEILEANEQAFNTIQIVLGGIGAISLFVAAIGITNTMIMSIYERTREIGVMKVIGAAVKDIRKLFLFESAFIGLLGGILGVLLSFLLSYILNIVGQNTGIMGGDIGDSVRLSIIPLWLVGASLVMSTLVGLVAGYLPAQRATRLSALEAIKTE